MNLQNKELAYVTGAMFSVYIIGGVYCFYTTAVDTDAEDTIGEAIPLWSSTVLDMGKPAAKIGTCLLLLGTCGLVATQMLLHRASHQ
jgi:hypothetical protein